VRKPTGGDHLRRLTAYRRGANFALKSASGSTPMHSLLKFG